MKVYELYRGADGPTTRSQWYARITKEIWQVAANDAKQAVLLCSRHTWYTGKNAPGIIAYKHTSNDHNDGKCWTRWDGVCENWSSYKHGRVFKGNP